MELVDVEGTAVAVREWGPADGRPLVFWHALGPATSGALAAEVAVLLAETHEVRTLALDAPGYGASPPVARERYAVGSLAGLLLGVVDVFELERPLLMGHSWGGVVVEAATSARPGGVSGLVLLDSGHLDYQDLPTFPADTSWEGLLAEASKPERHWRFLDREELRTEVADGVPRSVTDALLGALLAGMREDEDGALVGIPTPDVRAASVAGLCDLRASATWPAIAAAGIPVLLLVATEPDELRAQNEAALPAFRDALPAAEVHRVQGAGHGLLVDRPEEVARRIGDWLSHA